MTDERGVRETGRAHRSVAHPFHGLALATFGALVLTPDTLLMRLSGMEGFAMLAWRGVLMGSVLLAVWAVARRGAARRADLRVLFSGAGLAVAGCHALSATFFSLGVASAPVAPVLFGVATVPVFAALLARVLLGEPTAPATWGAMAAVFAGIGLAVLSSPEGGEALSGGAALGALMGLGVAALMALSFVLIRRDHAVPILACIGLGALLSGLLGLVMSPPEALHAGAAWAIALSGAVVLPLSFFALSLATRHTAAATVSLLLLLETVLGPVWVWLGTGEAMTPGMIAGGVVVVASLAFYLRATSRRAAGPGATP